MRSLRLALPRPQGLPPSGVLNRPWLGRGVLGIVPLVSVKASSGVETTSVSYSTIAPSSSARSGLRREPLLGHLIGVNHSEEKIEKVIYRCRFFAFLAVAGSLMGSIICFLKGCSYVIDSFREYFLNGGKVILMLVEAIDVYLVGTVLLVFGMGLYELFISNLDIARMSSYGSNLFGLFKLLERPRWLEIQSVDELKTKLGHIIVMVLLVGMFEKSKKLFHMAKATAFKPHVHEDSLSGLIMVKGPSPRKLLEVIHSSRQLKQYQPPTTPGHSPSIGHGSPPNK